MGIYKFGNNTYPRRIRDRSNLGHIFWGIKHILRAGKYGMNTCNLFQVTNTLSCGLLNTCILALNLPIFNIINHHFSFLW